MKRLTILVVSTIWCLLTSTRCLADEVVYRPGDILRVVVDKLKSGDTLILEAQSNVVGYTPDQQGQGNCDNNYTYECVPKKIPSGIDKDHPTRIIAKAGVKLVAIERASQIFDLRGSNWVTIEGDPNSPLELTDGEACMELGPPNLYCTRGKYPSGNWGQTAIRIGDSQGIVLKNLNIHGFADRGVYAGRYKDIYVENVNIHGNAWAGWDGDIESGPDLISGINVFKNLKIKWNGCVENVDGTIKQCTTQGTGGYGDGFTVDNAVAGTKIIFDSPDFSYNSSDGADLIYITNPVDIQVKNLKAEGNLGQQFKSSGNTIIDGFTVYGNCGYWKEGPYSALNMNWCRAAGNTFSFGFFPGVNITLKNGLVDKNDGDVIIETFGDKCNGSESLNLDTVILNGGIHLRQGDWSAGIYHTGATGNGDGPCGDIKTTAVKTAFNHLKDNQCFPGIGNTCSEATPAPVPIPIPLPIPTPVPAPNKISFTYDQCRIICEDNLK